MNIPGLRPSRDREETSETRFVAALAFWLGTAALFWYALLISIGGKGLFGPVTYGLTFNSMLVHLLHGRFDVDPRAIGVEGSIRGGATYVYFGVFPAFFRLLFLPFRNFVSTDYTRISCLVAVSLMALFKTLSVLRVWRSVLPPRGRLLVVLFIIAVLFSGPQVEFNRPSIYQEVDLWADAFAAAFVYVALLGYFSDRGFTPGLLLVLALLAALTLHTRVSTALGLYIAMGLIWLELAWSLLREEKGERARLSRVLALFATALILLSSAAVAGLINYERWGNPFLFGLPGHHLIVLKEFPGRLRITRKYGLFNFIRIGYGLMYYFFPLWGFHDANGNFFWGAFQHRTIASIELPPDSFFISDPLLLGLTAYSFVHLIKYRDLPKPNIVIALLAGFSVPVVLILIAVSMSYRYRIEFYPFLEFASFIGFGQLLSLSPKRHGAAFAAATLWSVLAAIGWWMLYAVSPLGPATKFLGRMDVVSYYLSLFRH